MFATLEGVATNKIWANFTFRKWILSLVKSYQVTHGHQISSWNALEGVYGTYCLALCGTRCLFVFVVWQPPLKWIKVGAPSIIYWSSYSIRFLLSMNMEVDYSRYIDSGRSELCLYTNLHSQAQFVSDDKVRRRWKSFMNRTSILK